MRVILFALHLLFLVTSTCFGVSTEQQVLAAKLAQRLCTTYGELVLHHITQEREYGADRTSFDSLRMAFSNGFSMTLVTGNVLSAKSMVDHNGKTSAELETIILGSLREIQKIALEYREIKAAQAIPVSTLDCSVDSLVLLLDELHLTKD